MRNLSAAGLLALLLPAATHAAPLDDVRRHIAETRTMTARFVQTATGGATETGKVVLARPGKVRFQYDRARYLVVADGKAVHFIDYDVDQVTRWPIRGTPLAVMLDPTIDLARYARQLPAADPAVVRIEAADPKHPEYGVTTLDFRRDVSAPGGLRLIGWSVLDSQGNTTRVDLSDQRFNQPVQDSNFTFRDPRRKIVPGRG